MVQLGEKDQGCKMIAGLKKNTQKQTSLCYKKLNMSKKNSNVILSNGFRKFKDLSEVYLNFKDKLKNLKNRSCLVAVSGGPDSLALVALSQAFSFEKKIKFFYVLINHNIRASSSKEAKKVKSLLKKHKINLHIITNKKAINRNVQGQARKVRYDFLKQFCKKKT